MDPQMEWLAASLVSAWGHPVLQRVWDKVIIEQTRLWRTWVVSMATLAAPTVGLGGMTMSYCQQLTRMKLKTEVEVEWTAQRGCLVRISEYNVFCQDLQSEYWY